MCAFLFCRLIKQYEQTIEKLKRKVDKLQKELGSSGESIVSPCSEKTIVRNSQTNTSIKVVCKVETETHYTDSVLTGDSNDVPSEDVENDAPRECNQCGTADNEASNSIREECLDMVDGIDDMFHSFEDESNTCVTNRPKTLNINVDFDTSSTNSSNASSSDSTGPNRSSVLVIDGYSYAKRSENGEFTNSLPTRLDRPNQGIPCNLSPVSNNTDGNGYLLFDSPLDNNDEFEDSEETLQYQEALHMSLKEMREQEREKDINERSPEQDDVRPEFGLWTCPPTHKVDTSNILSF